MLKHLDDRVLHDSQFANLVSQFDAIISQGKFTPSEIREAAMYAQIRYEMFNPRPVTFSPQLLEEIKFRMNE